MRRVGQLVHFANCQLHNRIAFNRSTRLFRASGATAADQDFLMELRGFEMMAIVAISSSKTMVNEVPTVFGRLEAKPANG